MVGMRLHSLVTVVEKLLGILDKARQPLRPLTSNQKEAFVEGCSSPHVKATGSETPLSLGDRKSVV